MAVSKMIYFSGDVFEQATTGIEKGDVSKRINELIQKGLLYEKNDKQEIGKVGLKEVIKYLISVYNKNHSQNPITYNIL